MLNITPASAPGDSLLRRLAVHFDPAGRTLERGGRQRRLAPREARLLTVLLGFETGAVIGREELLDAIWGDGDVCDDALTVLVSRLRRHFDRLGVNEEVIQTVPRRGYRLGNCPVSQGPWQDARRSARLPNRLGLAALAVSMLALTVACLALIRVAG
ncbi:MAG: winged helix-turn-helix domain-containing protein [Xanthomonadales bacterium]|nr:winged helix-turn-helix domain-containing protein [Xanthomonadales bacterium]